MIITMEFEMSDTKFEDLLKDDQEPKTVPEQNIQDDSGGIKKTINDLEKLTDSEKEKLKNSTEYTEKEKGKKAYK